eukprot:c24941_g1_i2 orf=466-2298(+)
MWGLRSRSLPKVDKAFVEIVPDELTEQQSYEGTSSTTSFDRFCSDLLGDGSFIGSPREPFWSSSPGDESRSASVESSPLGWPISKLEKSCLRKVHTLPKVVNPKDTFELGETKKKADDVAPPETEMMKERFAKLLLGEDMSGGGKGVCPALAISNAITNLSASVFGELWRLEPLAEERKQRWRREMDWLLAVSDYIVEFVPSCQTLPDGSTLEVMVTKPRSDLQINLPAMMKLDTMLLDSLDSFNGAQFWYAEQAIGTPENDRTSLQRQEGKWWLPTPRVPSSGLSEDARKQLQQQRESVNQILKAALAINGQVLSEMEVPSVYWEALPKNGRTSLGEPLYHIMASEHFSPEALISSLDSSNEHNTLELVNRVEAALHVWRRKIQVKQTHTLQKEGKSNSKGPWGLAKDSGGELERREVLAERAESFLLLLRHKFPGLPQTILDMNKIQYNKDVGKSILESYSRVLESLASNIIFRIDDVLHIDNLTKCIRPSTDISKTSTNELAFVRVSSSSVLSREDCKAAVAHSESLAQSICSVQCTDAFPDESLSSVQHSPRKKLSDLIGWKHKVSEFHEKPDSNIPGKSVISGWPKKPCSYMENIVAVQSPPSRD